MEGYIETDNAKENKNKTIDRRTINSKKEIQVIHKKGIYERFLKRPLDFFCALIALILLSPLLLVTAILVRVKLGSPVIFKQKRPGLNEKIFTLYKFRSMTDSVGKNGKLLSDEERLTAFGKKLRASSLDELPEIWNILKGDMSFVGPRPQLVRDMVFMTEEQRKRHTIRQGLTGLAQVNGRNQMSWEQKLNYDLQYVEKLSFIYDVRIIIQTVKKVIVRDGISAEGMETAEDFGDYLLRTGKIDNITYKEKLEQVQ